MKPCGKIDIDVTWSLVDILDNQIVEFSNSNSSSWFCNLPDDSLNKKMIYDALDNSFIDFIDQENVQLILKEKKLVQTKYAFLDTIFLAANFNKTSLDDMAKSVITIKTSNGHGSACVLTNDGYIVTNYHLVKNDTNDINVYFDNEHQMVGKLIRCNPTYDLALIKVDTINLKPIQISNNIGKSIIGKEVFAIGTPLDIEFSQTISKGIISGNRTISDFHFIQTDAKINLGNSGGALVTREDGLFGIVNAKLIGKGVEGISYAIPIIYLEEALKIKLIQSQLD